MQYYSDPLEAVAEASLLAREAGECTPVLFLLNPTTVEQVRAVADERDCMPHKSTYFYPKAVTGLLLNPLTEGQEQCTSHD